MERFPSKIGLFITRMCNIVSGALLAFGISSFCMFLLPKWIGVCITISLWGLWVYSIWASWCCSYKVWFLRFRTTIKANRMLKQPFADQWQWQWISRTSRFGFQKGEEWRVAQAVVLTFIALAMAGVFEAWRYPQYAVRLSVVWPGYLIMSFLIGSMSFAFSFDSGRNKKPKSPPTGPFFDPPDDFGPAGVGARLIPPRPTLVAGSQFPVDDERYA